MLPRMRAPLPKALKWAKAPQGGGVIRLSNAC